MSQEFIQYAKLFKTRPRQISRFDDFKEDGYLCYQNALLTSEEKHYSLVSGYIYNVVSDNFVWYCFNVDPQGYVYDTAPQGVHGEFYIYIME